MKIQLISVGKNMPSWVNEGYQFYARRLNKPVQLDLIEVPQGQKSKKSDPITQRRIEADSLLKSVPAKSQLIALDVKGKSWSTEQLAEQVGKWIDQGRGTAILIGGPDGLDPRCLQEADMSWSLSPLTLPHPLVRVVVAEQLYRAVSILENHPYHRA